MSGISLQRIGWLARRLSRIYPAEIPYRIATVIRGSAQSLGWFDARQIPRNESNSRYGNPWVKIPPNGLVDTLALSKLANRHLTEGVQIFDIRVPLVNGAADWNRDPKTGQSIGTNFGLSIDFRHLASGVDIKYLWELNRHIWWVHLAQCFATTGNQHYLESLRTLLLSWLDACPYPKGANWSSPVEHGIRLINWSIIWHLIGGTESILFAGTDGATLRARWIASVYQHIRFASDNYSLHSSADNHLIGEAAGLFVAAHTWDLWGEVRDLRRQAKQILEAEALKQFSSDGVNAEQAICYHKFSLEFLLAATLAGEANDDCFSAEYMQRMQSAVEFMAAMMDCNGDVPAIGDSDDGQVFRFGGDGFANGYESLLAAGAALFGSQIATEKARLLSGSSRADASWLKFQTERTSSTLAPARVDFPTRFLNGGYLLMGRELHQKSEFRLSLDVGPLGSNRVAGHGHADALSLLLSVAGEGFLVDPGTYCYNAAPAMRHYFRGTSAHNTVLIDDVDQSIYGGSFLWLRDVSSKLHKHEDDGIVVMVEASHDGYMRLKDPLRHFRRLEYDRSNMTVTVEDWFECKSSHTCAVHWHFEPECDVRGSDARWTATRSAGTLSIVLDHAGLKTAAFAGRENPPLGWVSKQFYRRQPATVIASRGTIEPGIVLRTMFAFSPRPTLGLQTT